MEAMEEILAVGAKIGDCEDFFSVLVSGDGING